MTLLAHVNTELGKIELHHEDGSFTTRRDFASIPSGRLITIKIPVFRDSAQEWYELALRRGAVHQPFPAQADTERKAS